VDPSSQAQERDRDQHAEARHSPLSLGLAGETNLSVMGDPNNRLRSDSIHRITLNDNDRSP